MQKKQWTALRTDTKIALAIAGGYMLWLNLFAEQVHMPGARFSVFDLGWPFIFETRHRINPWGIPTYWLVLLANIGVCTAILFVAGFVIESAARRQIFQIHLDTALMLTFVVALLLWANLTPATMTSNASSRDPATEYFYGWPWTACHRIAYTDDSLTIWSYALAALNTIVCLTVIAVATVLFELPQRKQDNEEPCAG